MGILFQKILEGVPFIDENESKSKPRAIYKKALIERSSSCLDDEKIAGVLVHLGDDTLRMTIPTSPEKFKGKRFRLVGEKVLADFKKARKKLTGSQQ